MNVAITGEGILSAIGLDKQQTLQALRDGKTGIGEMKYLHSVHHELPVGEVALSNEEMKELLGIPASRLLSRTTLMGMLAIKQALVDAGLDDVASHPLCRDDGSPVSIMLLSGTTVGGMDLTEQYYGHDDEVSKEIFQQYKCGNNTQLMADHFGIFTAATTISTACSSAANAIMLGARYIKAGHADIVVAGGTEALTRFHLNGFNSLMILDESPCRPFDATRAGLNLGEGAAFVVLESQQMAARRGVTPHAYLTGYGNACDAFHQTASSENGEGAYLAMKEALEMAHLSASDIQYVNAHGTGTPNNDLSESVALQRVFGNEMPWISSTKSFTGHTTSASGSIETVICLLAMSHHFVPANLGWEHQMEGGITPTLGVRDVTLHHILCNSFGFGGNDSSLIISDAPRDDDATDRENFKKDDIKVLAQVEISSEEQLKEIHKYVKPLEARRMGKLMKSTLLSSLQALEQAGLTSPDAIITTTRFGNLEYSERLLEQMKTEGEVMLKPTYFMQSTHNTIGSNVAIKTHCHGYNVTYMEADHSLEWDIYDAVQLLQTGKAKNVLVGRHDESTPLFNQLMKRYTGETEPPVRSIAMVLSCGE